MAETLAPPVTETAAPQGLIARMFGVLLSPRKTYADVAARPRWLGMLAVVLLIIATCSVVFSSTEVGKQALLDQQVRTMESFGIKLPDAGVPADGRTDGPPVHALCRSSRGRLSSCRSCCW